MPKKVKSLSNGLYFTELKKMNWQAAKDFCAEKKAKMVVMENKEIQAEIAAAFKELTDEPNKNRFWLDAKEGEKAEQWPLFYRAEKDELASSKRFLHRKES